MTVTIPRCEQHEGMFKTTVKIFDYCPKCGKKRGTDTIHKGFSYDGSLRLTVDCWSNPCGHIDKYSDVRQEAIIYAQAEKEAENYCHSVTIDGYEDEVKNGFMMGYFIAKFKKED